MVTSAQTIRDLIVDETDSRLRAHGLHVRVDDDIAEHRWSPDIRENIQAATLAELQHTPDTFRDYYNHVRPHRGIGRKTPEFAYRLIPKATPTKPADPNIWRVRYDTIDNDGKITLNSGELLAEFTLNPETNYQRKNG